MVDLRFLGSKIVCIVVLVCLGGIAHAQMIRKCIVSIESDPSCKKQFTKYT